MRNKPTNKTSFLRNFLPDDPNTPFACAPNANPYLKRRRHRRRVLTESALLPGHVGRVMERTQNRRVPVHGYDQYGEYRWRRHEHGQRLVNGLRTGHEQRTEDGRRQQIGGD